MRCRRRGILVPLSLILLAVTLVLWVRSYWWYNALTFGWHSSFFRGESNRGEIWLEFCPHWPWPEAGYFPLLTQRPVDERFGPSLNMSIAGWEGRYRRMRVAVGCYGWTAIGPFYGPNRLTENDRGVIEWRPGNTAWYQTYRLVFPYGVLLLVPVPVSEFRAATPHANEVYG